jgi:RHS repeat-associated protein
MRLGNGRFESTQFNSRLQPTQIALGTSATNTSLLKLEYDYGTTDNNGNVKSQTITVPTVGATPGFTAVQDYSYDQLNRLLSATETRTGQSQPDWKQTFLYERYGNRTFDEANTTTLVKNCGTTQSPEVCPEDRKRLNPSVSTTNNRFTEGQGYEYDSSGNVTKDATDKRFIYDAENKQTSFGTGGSSTNGGTYFYDGDGKRVKKIVGTETTIFVYNASGQMVAEYSTTAPPTTPKISYLTTDTLGTPRINTDASGQVLARHDYLPFGEEIANGVGGRTTQQGYGGQDNIRQKFTQQERDEETGLDYFLARYYSSGHGRFTSADPLFASGRGANPQTWNRYAYVLNNPLRLVDPTGLMDDDPQQDKKKAQEPQKPRTIYVFVTFTKAEQSQPVEPNTKKIKPFTIPAPNFEGLAKNAPKGTTVQVVEGDAATVEAFTNALQDPNAAGVFYIGHSAGQYDENGNFSAGGLTFADGVFDPEEPVDVRAQTVGIFGCDSQATRDLFSLPNDNQAFIGVDSGTNGLTATNSLTRAGFSVVQATVRGRGPDQATAAASGAFGGFKARAPTGETINVRQNELNIGDSVRRLP